jgi:hypothetical protein
MNKLKGKIFITFLSIVSIVWISYVAFDLIYKKNNLIPERIFSKLDQKVLIINRINEVDLSKLEFKSNAISEEFIIQLGQNSYQNEVIYISKERPIILVQLQRHWDEKTLHEFLKQKKITFKLKENKIILKDGFSYQFQGKNLIISKCKIKINNKSEWLFIDNYASASIIDFTKSIEVHNIYFSDNGTINYHTFNDKNNPSNKIDDAELFAKELPAEISDYHFYEKNHALIEEIINDNSPLLKWVDEGFVLFSYKGILCLMSDYNKIIDPISVINNQFNSNFKVGDLVEIENGLLNKNFRNKFYVDHVSDKVLISNNQSIINEIQANYQIGKTLALNTIKFNSIFDKLPKKTHERKVFSEEKYTLSYYDDLIVKTKIQSESFSSKDLNGDKKNHFSFGINGNLVEIVILNNQQVCFLNDNHVISFEKLNQLWQLKLDNDLIYRPVSIDFAENDKKGILVHTKNSINLIDENGTTKNGFPLICSPKSPPSFYKWNGKSNFLVVNDKQELLQIDVNGTILKKYKLNCKEVSNEIIVSRKNGKLIATIPADNKTFEFDLEANKVLKEYESIEKESVVLKKLTNHDYFYINSEGLFKTNIWNETSKLKSSSHLTNLKKIKSKEKSYICFNDAQNIYIVNEENKVTTIQLYGYEIDNFDLLFENNQLVAIALLDGIQNKIHILNSNGKPIKEKAFDGKEILKLNKYQGNIFLTTSLQNNIIQYIIN